jgi:hypothetical protein
MENVKLRCSVFGTCANGPNCGNPGDRLSLQFMIWQQNMRQKEMTASNGFSFGSLNFKVLTLNWILPVINGYISMKFRGKADNRNTCRLVNWIETKYFILQSRENTERNIIKYHECGCALILQDCIEGGFSSCHGISLSRGYKLTRSNGPNRVGESTASFRNVVFLSPKTTRCEVPNIYLSSKRRFLTFVFN